MDPGFDASEYVWHTPTGKPKPFYELTEYISSDDEVDWQDVTMFSPSPYQPLRSRRPFHLHQTPLVLDEAGVYYRLWFVCFLIHGRGYEQVHSIRRELSVVL